jgi:transposase InsO family protein
MTTMEAALETADLIDYCTGEVTTSTSDSSKVQKRWIKANALVRSILTANMTEEVIGQIGHIKKSSGIWSEATRLFAGQTLTDWTLLITSLISTKYQEGEDVTVHIAKMRSYRRDLILMRRDIDDTLFAAFIRISMPQSWNYVFAGLPARYTSVEVEHRIKDEYGTRTNQAGGTTAYQAQYAPKGKAKKRNEPIPGQPFCTNCNKPGHTVEKCYSRGGGAEGQGPRQQKRQKKPESKAKSSECEKCCKKNPKRANQAVTARSVAPSEKTDSGTEDNDSTYMATARPGSAFGWILDGGSTTHLCKVCSAFTTFRPTESIIHGINKGGPQLEVKGIGTVKILVSVNGQPNRVVTLKDVCYTPDARDNLVSESRMDRAGLSILKERGNISIRKKNSEIVMEGSLRQNLYELNCVIAPPSAPASNVAFTAQTLISPDLELWHRHLGHINPRSIFKLKKYKLVSGLTLEGKWDSAELGPCNGCAKGKHPQAPFPTTAKRAEKIIERLHMDLQGPFDRSIKGYLYTLAVVDDHSRKGWKIFMAQKSDTVEEIKTLITHLETLTESKVKFLRSDNGGEFINKELGTYLKQKGITHELSAPYMPQQNGVAEHFNRTTHESALAMLKEAKMSNAFWPEAHEYASYTRNRSPTRALVRKTPNEAFHGKAPDISTLRVFGSRCHVRVPPES